MKHAAKKYEITKIAHPTRPELRRIRALRDIGDPVRILAGSEGGWVENDQNLAQEGDCWIFHNGIVSGKAKIKENARVYDRAEVKDFAVMEQNSSILNDAALQKHAAMSGCAVLGGRAIATDYSVLDGRVSVSGNSKIFGTAILVNGSVQGHAAIWDRKYYTTLEGLPSGRVSIYPTQKGGHEIKIGCWSGTVKDLRDLIAGNDWPAAMGEEILRRRPVLEQLANLTDAIVLSWSDPSTWQKVPGSI